MSVAQAVGELERITTVLASCGGRDKFMRLVDYQMRAITYFMSQASPKHPQLANLNAFGAHLILARKLFRFGRTLEFVLGFIKVLKSSHDPVTLLLSLGKAMGYGVWLFYDNLVYLTKFKLIADGSAPRWDERAARFWFLGILCTLLMNIRTIVQNGILNKPTPPSEYLQLVRNSLDLLVPATKLGMRPALLVAPNKGVVGLTGVVSSLISLYLLWPARKTLPAK